VDCEGRAVRTAGISEGKDGWNFGRSIRGHLGLEKNGQAERPQTPYQPATEEGQSLRKGEDKTLNALGKKEYAKRHQEVHEEREELVLTRAEIK